MRRALPHTDSPPCPTPPHPPELHRKSRVCGLLKNKQKPHTEQYCKAKGRRLGRREGTKRCSSTAGLMPTAAAGSPHHAQLGVEFLPLPLAANLRDGESRGPQRSLAPPRHHSAQSTRGVSAGCCKSLHARCAEKPESFHSPPSSPGATRPDQASLAGGHSLQIPSSLQPPHRTPSLGTPGSPTPCGMGG